MASTGEQHTQQILNDLACPQCEYNLRGLRGPIVNCPECGVPCNIPRMIAQQWARPWWEAPGFNRLITPLAWIVISGCAVFVAYIFDLEQWKSGGLITAALALVALVGWAFLINWAPKEFEDERGIVLVIFLHALFVGYILGTVGALMLAIRALSSGSPIQGVVTLPVIAALVVMLVFCRKGERYVAEQCIKRHLRLSGGADSRTFN